MMKFKTRFRPKQLDLFIDALRPGGIRTEKRRPEKPKPAQEGMSSDDDLDGFLPSMWKRIRIEWFPEQPKLDEYRIVWSTRRHTRTLASCSIRSRRILVAKAMSLPEASPYLEPLLYHEMCHAALGRPPVVDGRRILHGREFKALERRHPGVVLLDGWIKTGGWAKVARRANQLRGAQKRVERQSFMKKLLAGRR